ncbi:Trp repressor binding protein [Bacillus sp. JCM 19045]|uniref:Multimeric flavodoxin WrbA n=1 Tax=Shouchella xiaoxiensis TaxID=766895 RepID=A0ABS2SP71_9BACI|nr:NAD(P)H-dependent oxidoreductase [Shouchella xiaoxiensis]MBM7837314.1 multimeric flavodoxin WrbA [Shouchella xiaoxiensis]GAF11503.1 Trp repressor binding protein [Bacillus sp. JCM 19045]
MKIATIIGSTRRGGNTEELAQMVTADIPTTIIKLSELTLHPFTDLRHTKEGFPSALDDYDQIVQAFMENDLLIFATPLYWYGMSSLMKTMFDRLSQALRDEHYGPQLKARMPSVEAIVLVVGGDQPKLKALPLIQQFHFAFDFLQMKPLSSYIIGEANQPGEIKQDYLALQQAQALNKALKNKV